MFCFLLASTIWIIFSAQGMDNSGSLVVRNQYIAFKTDSRVNPEQRNIVFSTMPGMPAVSPSIFREGAIKVLGAHSNFDAEAWNAWYSGLQDLKIQHTIAAGQAMQMSGQASHVMAQLSFIDMKGWPGTNSAKTLDAYREQILKTFCDSDGRFVGIHTQKQQESFLRNIFPYLKSSLTTTELTNLLGDLKSIVPVENMRQYVQGKDSWGHYFSEWAKEIGRDCKSVFSSNSYVDKVRQHPFNKDLMRLMQYCGHKDYAGALKLIDTYKNVYDKSSPLGDPQWQYAMMKNFYETFCVAHDIPLPLTRDPYFSSKVLPKLYGSQSSSEYSQVRSELLQILQQRYGQVLVIAKKFHVDLSTAAEVTVKTCYELIDIKNSDYQQFLSDTATKLGISDIRQSPLQSFYLDNGLVKDVLYAKATQEYQMPGSILLSENKEIRVLFDRFAQLDRSHKTIDLHITKAIDALSQACNSSSAGMKSDCVTYAKGILRALTIEGADRSILVVDSGASALKEKNAESVYQRGISELALAAKMLESASANPTSTPVAITSCAREKIKTVRCAFEEAKKGNVYQAAVTLANQQVMTIDAKAHQRCLQQFGQVASVENLIPAFDLNIRHQEQRVKALTDIQNQGCVYSSQNYEIAPHALRYLGEHGIPVDQYKTCYGNQLQRALHQEHVDIIHYQAQQVYSGKVTEHFVAVNQLSTQLNQVGIEANKEGFLGLSSTISDFSRSVAYVTDAGYRGIEALGQGAIQGVESIINIVQHPVKFAEGVTATACYLAKAIHLSAQCVGLPGGPLFPKESNPRQALIDHVAPLYNALKEKMHAMGPTDYIREGTAFAVESVICNKVIGCANTFVAKTAEAANRWSTALKGVTAEELLAAVEGAEIKISEQAAKELSNLNKAALEQKAQKLTQVVENEVRVAKPLDYGHSNIQYEQLKTALSEEQLNSFVKEIAKIVDCTKHGLERILEREFTLEEIHSLLTKPDYIKTQTGGRTVFIKQIGEDKYNYFVFNSKNKVVTAIRNIDKEAVINLSKNGGWTI